MKKIEAIQTSDGTIFSKDNIKVAEAHEKKLKKEQLFEQRLTNILRVIETHPLSGYSGSELKTMKKYGLVAVLKTIVSSWDSITPQVIITNKQKNTEMDDDGSYAYQCKCSGDVHTHDNYCGNCGAKLVWKLKKEKTTTIVKVKSTLVKDVF
jgi:hypothetical protein